MNKADFRVSVEKLHEICMETLFKKGVEYQNNTKSQDDVLANFSRGSALVDIIPEKVLLIYLSKHWDSVSKFVKSIDDKPFEEVVKNLSEPIHMRLVDVINYCYLLNAMIEDRVKNLTLEQTTTTISSKPLVPDDGSVYVVNPNSYVDPDRFKITTATEVTEDIKAAMRNMKT